MITRKEGPPAPFSSVLGPQAGRYAVRCPYVCIYLSACVCLYVCVYLSEYVSVFVSVCVWLSVCLCVSICICICLSACVCLSVCACVCLPLCAALTLSLAPPGSIYPLPLSGVRREQEQSQGRVGWDSLVYPPPPHLASGTLRGTVKSRGRGGERTWRQIP